MIAAELSRVTIDFLKGVHEPDRKNIVRKKLTAQLKWYAKLDETYRNEQYESEIYQNLHMLLANYMKKMRLRLYKPRKKAPSRKK